jgi:hypothetical protein
VRLREQIEHDRSHALGLADLRGQRADHVAPAQELAAAVRSVLDPRGRQARVLEQLERVDARLHVHRHCHRPDRSAD